MQCHAFKVPIAAGARIGGSYKRSPFFDAASGMPVLAPHVLTKAERERLNAQP